MNDDLSQVEKDIIKIMKAKQNSDEVNNIVMVILLLEELDKSVKFLQYLKEHPEQDFDEVLQVAYAYATEKTKEI